MRKLVVLGTVLACLAAVGFQDAAAARRPVEVTGTVEVSNLPLDAEGNVRVSGCPAPAATQPHFVALTQAISNVPLVPLALSRVCAAEFPGTRVCQLDEILFSIPPPPEWAGFVVTFKDLGATFAQPWCLPTTGGGALCSSAHIPAPAACCGF